MSSFIVHVTLPGFSYGGEHYPSHCHHKRRDCWFAGPRGPENPGWPDRTVQNSKSMQVYLKKTKKKQNMEKAGSVLVPWPKCCGVSSSIVPAT